MKTVVFITGTNSSGKSSIALNLIERFGGIAKEQSFVTYCNDGKNAFAGVYQGLSYGGVDRIRNEKGVSCTSMLATIVREGLSNSDTIFCEGSFMDTFGLNLTNALFAGDKALVVSLYAPPAIILDRIIKRSNGKNGKRSSENLKRILAKQVRCMRAAKKFQSRGVKTLQYDTSVTSMETITNEILKTIKLMNDGIL